MQVVRKESVPALGLGVSDSVINQLCVLRLLRSSENQGWVGRSILGFVLSNSFRRQV